MAVTIIQRFVQLSGTWIGFCRCGQVGNTSVYGDVSAGHSNGCGVSENANHGCLLTGVLRMGRLDDRSRMSREAHVRFCEGCALQAQEIQLPEMAAAVKLSQQLRTESCVVFGNGHCEA